MDPFQLYDCFGILPLFFPEQDSLLPDPSSKLDSSPPDSLASSYASIGITVAEPVDEPVDPIAATPSTSSSTHSFFSLHNEQNHILAQTHTLGHYPDLTDSASASSTGSNESTGLVKRSFARSCSPRGRQLFRRDSRPPNIILPSDSTPPESSLHPESTGPHTEPNLNDVSFDWSIPSNPAFLSPPPSSTLEIRRRRSASFRSHRAASVSAQSGPTFLNVPGPTRPRSTSVPSEPTAEFYSNIPALAGLHRCRSRPRSPAPGPSSVTSGSPSVASNDDFQDSFGSGTLPELQLPAAHGTYNPYDITSSYHPSPDFPLLELDGLNIYSHANSSASSIASQVSPSPQPHTSEVANLLLTSDDMGFNNIDNEFLSSMPPLTHTTGGVPYHDNDSGGPSISVTSSDNSSAYLDVLGDIDLRFFMPDFSHIPNLDGSNVCGGSFIDPFPSNESGATSQAADTLPYPAASSGDSDRSFLPFGSPFSPALEYENLIRVSSVAVPAFLDGQGSNKRHSFQAEALAGNYTHSGGQHASDMHPRISENGMHGKQPTIRDPPKHGVRPRIWGATTGLFHAVTAAAGAHLHWDKTTEGSSRPTRRGNEELLGLDVGSKCQRVRRQLWYPGLEDPTNDNASNPETSSSSSARRLSRASSDNDLDPQFEAKKHVYKILTESKSKDKALATVTDRARELKWRLIRSVFDEASQRKVKSTPAGQQRAEGRRSRPPTFFCILCKNKFTTNNNLQNHYRSHLRMDQYRCPRCGDFFRTEGIRKRHTDGAQKCRRLHVA